MLIGSRLFVVAVFSAIALAFWATTAQLFLEYAYGTNLWTLDKPIDVAAAFRNYQSQPWFLLLTHFSDLFLFFPIFGCIALVAFFTPAAVLVDIYWNTEKQGKRRLPYAQLRFIASFIIVLGLSLWLGWPTVGGTERTLWQLKPQVLAADKGAGCVADKSCQRVGLLDGLMNVRMASRERTTLYDLKRDCRRDWFVQATGEKRSPRYCPVTTNLRSSASELDGLWVDNPKCCAAEQLYDAAVKASYNRPANRSATAWLQARLWPAYIYFLLTLFVISSLLAFRRMHIEQVYPEYSRAIDRGVLVGAVAMLMLPLMHNGFLLSTNLLHGNGGNISYYRVPEFFTAAFAAWVVIVVISFLHPANKQAEPFSRIMGVIASVVFALKGDVVTDYVIRLFGAGAGRNSLILMAAIAIGLIATLWGWRRVSVKSEVRDAEPSSAPALPAAPTADQEPPQPEN